MATKNFLRDSEYLKTLLAAAESDIVARETLIQILVTHSGFEWGNILATLLKTDLELAYKLIEKLRINYGAVEPLSAARRYYVCDERFGDIEHIRDIPYYSSYVYPEQLELIPPRLTTDYTPTTLVNPEDLYSLSLPNTIIRASDELIDPAIGTPEETDENLSPNTSYQGLDTISSDYLGVELFQIPTYGAEEDLCPTTFTTPPDWTHDNASFAIRSNHDYHFAVKLNLSFTTDGFVTAAAQNVPPLWKAPDLQGNRGIDFGSNLAPTMVALYARVFNPISGIDEDRLSLDWKQFIKLDEAKVSTRLIRSSNTALKEVSLNGGFRLRNLLDDFTHSDFINSGGLYPNRPKVSRVDFFLAVRTLDILANQGPIAFYLKKRLRGNQEVSNFIDVIDLGEVL